MTDAETKSIADYEGFRQVDTIHPHLGQSGGRRSCPRPWFYGSGWKHIVVTVGEKIGKTHLTYAQGASAETFAMFTILGSNLGLPVSTTHVLSSGVAGTMAANKSGLQLSAVRSIAAAWVFTPPAAALLSGCSPGSSAAW